jgi:dihydrolipoamide dehydrogenase
MEKFDLIVIGGGPAGYAAAMRAIDFGKRVCLIEKDLVGGAGLYNGALSSKTLWEISQKVYEVNRVTKNLRSEAFSLSWDEVRMTLEEAMFERKFHYSCHLKLLQNKLTHRHFEFKRGFGKLLSKNEVEISHNEEKEVIYGDYIILSTGSKPRILPNIPVDHKHILTSDGIEHIKNYPKSLVIIGAGVIGCEYATIFSNFGQTKVYIIDRKDRILPFEDADVSEIVSKNLKLKGVTIHSEAHLERIEVVDGEVEYELSYPDGSHEVIRVEKALVSVGRTPNLEHLGLENAGVTLSTKGAYVEDGDTVTNIPNIFAVGDLVGRIALVNMAEIEARYTVEKIFGSNPPALNYDNVCTIMFLHPEVALVGKNEQQCVQEGLSYKVVKLDYSMISRAIAMRRTEGFFKILVTNDDEMRILGMRAIGEHASSAIQAVGLLIKMNAPIETLSELVHPHPSIVEGIQECVRMLLNKSIFKSAVFKDKMSVYAYEAGVKQELEYL